MMNRFFLILLFVFLLMPAALSADGGQVVPDLIEDIPVEELLNEKQEVVPDLPDISEDLSSETIKKSDYKQPVSKRKILKKFLVGMVCVAFSAALLFVILKIFIGVRKNSEPPLEQSSDTSLTTPCNLHEAVKTFLEKTKWE